MYLATRVLAILVLFLVPTGAYAGDEPWPTLPDDTCTVLLLTGADQGRLRPPGCFKGAGGALYRPAFSQWLARRNPDREYIWLSTGNVVSAIPQSHSASSEDVFRSLESTGYRVMGLGREEVDSLGPVALWRRLAGSDLQVVAANLRVHETGKALFADSVVLETRAGRIAVIGVLPHFPEDVWGSPEHGTILTVDPLPAVARAVAAVRDEVDLVVLLSTLTQRDLQRVIRSVGDIDFVAATEGTLFSTRLREDEVVPIYWLGVWGQVLGQVGLAPGGRITSSQGGLVSLDFPVEPLTGKLAAGGKVESP